jgi:N-acetylmuramoyl-L-alanine amidase
MRLAAFFLAAALSLRAAPGPIPLLFIDPGHGGADRGVQADGLSEADLVLEIAQELQGLLKARGIDSVLSRDASSSPALSARVAAANASGARAFLSLHINHSPSPGVHGPRVFIAKPLPPGDRGEPSRWERAAGEHAEASRALAAELARALSTSEAAKVSVQNLNLAVLRGLELPGAMVELGFLSHAESRERFKDPQYRKELAGRLADGVTAWVRSGALTGSEP